MTTKKKTKRKPVESKSEQAEAAPGQEEVAAVNSPPKPPSEIAKARRLAKQLEVWAAHLECWAPVFEGPMQRGEITVAQLSCENEHSQAYSYAFQKDKINKLWERWRKINHVSARVAINRICSGAAIGHSQYDSWNIEPCREAPESCRKDYYVHCMSKVKCCPRSFDDCLTGAVGWALRELEVDLVPEDYAKVATAPTELGELIAAYAQGERAVAAAEAAIRAARESSDTMALAVAKKSVNQAIDSKNKATAEAMLRLSKKVGMKGAAKTFRTQKGRAKEAAGLPRKR